MKYANENSITQLATDLLTKVKEVSDEKMDKALAKANYQNIIATSNTQANGTFYMFKVRPNSFYEPCTIRFKIHGYINSAMTNANKLYYDEQTISEMIFTGTGLNYRNTNALYSTSYRPYYYLSAYRLTKGGYDAGLSHYIGPSLYNATGATTATLKRDFDLEILEVINGTFEVLDTPVLQSTFYSATNYSGITNTDATSAGTKQTGDNNSIDRLCYGSYQPKASDVALYGTQLVLSADGENFHSITNKRDASLTASTKIVNQYPFKPEHIFYYSSSTTVSIGNRVGTSTVYESLPFDFRFSYKGSALTAHKPVYLVAYYDEETDTFAPTSFEWIVQDIPTNDETACFILLGYAYSTTSIYLKPKHPVYKVYSGKVMEMDRKAIQSLPILLIIIWLAMNILDK